MLKNLIRRLDQIFLNQRLQKIYYKFWLKNELKKIAVGLDYRVISVYTKKDNVLAALCDRYGSDKGSLKRDGHPYSWPSHTYTDFYTRLFAHCRLNISRVFECGLGTNNPDLRSSMGILGKPGASLRVWRDYFPNAQIFGADIDRDVLFSEDRIKTFYIDQLDAQAIDSFWAQVGDAEFDFMLDDGLHTFEAGKCLFLNSIKHLRRDGIYVIEDVTTPDLLQFKEFFKPLNYEVEFVTMFRPNIPLADNSLVVIRKC
jgi:hypothetical protein